MRQQITVPEIGESITSGILAQWLKQEGEAVQEGDELFELETDKATLAVPSPSSGVLHHGVGDGEEVEVGQTVGEIDTDAAGSTPPAMSPAARRVAEEAGVDPAAINGTGRGGRITKEDAVRATDRKATSPEAPASVAAESRAGGAAGTGGETGAGTAAPRQERVEMTTLRKRVAENLVRSRQESAHVTTFNEIDMSRVMDIRRSFRDRFQERFDVKLGFMSFFVKAAVAALKRHPEANAFLDGTEIIYNRYYNIGVALSAEKGLMTPVIKDADRLSFAEIERQILDFIDRAGKRRIIPDELTGGTFTISNGGVFGSLLSTPIPSPPQTAVLGMHTIQKRPVAVDDQVVIRPMMYVALTYDHRMIDGREAVGFLRTIKELVEDPTALLLDV